MYDCANRVGPEQRCYRLLRLQVASYNALRSIRIYVDGQDLAVDASQNVAQATSDVPAGAGYENSPLIVR